jgi:putative membrane protein
MGTADVVPGVSGGTMAVAMGIYHRLLVAIASVNLHSLRALARFRLREAFSILHWRFLASLLAGIGMAVVVMIKIVKLPTLIETDPQPVYAVFFGLVSGSVVILARRVPEWSIMRGLAAAVAAVVGFLIVTLVPVSTPESMPFLFGCGMLAISAMLLPGISGSFVLLILGKYEYVLHALEGLMRFDLSQLKVVLPFALGCVAGLASFSRLLSWLMRCWHDTVVAALTGLLIGTLWRIWPYQQLKQEMVHGKLKVVEARAYWPDALEVSVVLLVLGGLVLVLGIEYLAMRRKTALAA